MLFNSPIFLLVFIPIFFVTYFAVRGIHLRNIVIVLFSIAFFAWGDPIFVWYVIAGTYIDYLIIKHILTNPNCGERIRVSGIIFAILINISALIFFKYANFFIDQINPLLKILDKEKPSWYGIALPLGISFIAFHKISFVIDLFKKRTSPPATFIDALLYILFFPQLIAGPIIRYHEISKQIRNRTHGSEKFIYGFFRFALGLGKKTLIADPVGDIANTIFSMAPETMPSHFAWIGVIAYTIQIYFDFSGYSDMAIGLGKVVGFRFPENFNQPYTSKSITEFWNRWHITLSNWMRLYLYIPLGGNRVRTWRNYINLWIVFLISGFWHGAAWNFILWGAYHGFFLTLEKLYKGRGLIFPIPRVLKQFITFIIIINSWVLFRSESIDYAMHFFGRMYGLVQQLQPTAETFALIFQPHGMTMLVVGLLIAMIPLPKEIYRILITKNSLKFDTIGWASGVMLFIFSLSAIMASGSSSFLYFRF
jgi:alginate O-acetyltransferase complex protein AlgI